MRSFISRPGSFDQGRGLAALWAGLLAGPLAWAASLEVNYVLSYVACETRARWMLHLTTALALTLVGAGAIAAAQAWRASTRHAVDDATLARVRFMALGGLAMCAWFALVILATEIPALVLRPCTP